MINNNSSLSRLKNSLRLPNPEGRVLFSAETEVTFISDPILRQWHYRERSRQAKWSFNISLVLAVVTTAFGIGTAVSLLSGNMTEAMATAVISLVSGAVTQRSFDLYKEANQRFDEAAKALSKE